MIEIYGESLKPRRPQGRRYSAAKVARLLMKRYQVEICRKTAWPILRRRGVWESPKTQKKAVRRFERARPNALWQIDLIEKEPSAIGDVHGVPIIDDHSRYLVGLRFYNHHFEVPTKYIGWNVWVANFFDQYVEIRAGNQAIGSFELSDFGSNIAMSS